jgi:hypothetical protein
MALQLTYTSTLQQPHLQSQQHRALLSVYRKLTTKVFKVLREHKALRVHRVLKESKAFREFKEYKAH